MSTHHTAFTRTSEPVAICGSSDPALSLDPGRVTCPDCRQICGLGPITSNPLRECWQVVAYHAGREVSAATLNARIEDPAMRHAPFTYNEHNRPMAESVAESLRDWFPAYTVKVEQVWV